MNALKKTYPYSKTSSLFHPQQNKKWCKKLIKPCPKTSNILESSSLQQQNKKWCKKVNKSLPKNLKYSRIIKSIPQQNKK